MQEITKIRVVHEAGGSSTESEMTMINGIVAPKEFEQAINDVRADNPAEKVQSGNLRFFREINLVPVGSIGGAGCWETIDENELY